ncbi:MAG: hypothetical protein R3C68_12785 [Myxococcota bacterium]
MYRVWLVSTCLHIILSAWLCFVPLLNLLGYEFSLAVGFLAALTSFAIGYNSARCNLGLVKTNVLAVAHLIPGLLLISLNALRVRNCDFGAGLLFYFLLPISTALYAAMLGQLTQQIAHHLVKRWVRLGPPLLIALVLLGPLFWSLGCFYFEPPIFAYNHLWGYFAGSLYDESIIITPTLWAFRGGTALRWLCIIALLLTLRRRSVGLPSPCARVALIGLIAVVVYEMWVGPAAGFNISRRHIEAALPTVIERPNLVIHLPPNTPQQLQNQIAEDHNFRLQQLSRRLQIKPSRPIHSFVYRDAEQKARLMGGHNTMFSKPWLREIHVHGLKAEHPVVAHELAHALAADFGSRLLGVSSRAGIFVNMGLIEGLATALSPPQGSLDLDRETAAMRSLGTAPNLLEILGPSGFWSQAPRRAYAVAGSFVTDLLQRYGPEPLKAAYPAADFVGAYGKPLQQLIDDWQIKIDALSIVPRDRRQAQQRFQTPSIFKRPCAHVISHLQDQAQQADAEQAIHLYRKICKHLHNSPQSRLDLAHALQRSGRQDDFLKLADELLSLQPQPLTKVEQSRLYENRGEVLWDRGDISGAKQNFEQALALQANLGSERLQWVRLWALEQKEPLRETLRSYLGRHQPNIISVLDLVTARLHEPQDKTLPYLIARALLRDRAYARAITYLHDAAGHVFLPIEAERVRLLAECHGLLSQWPASRQNYLHYAEIAPTSGERARALDAVERIDFNVTQQTNDSQSSGQK